MKVIEIVRPEPVVPPVEKIALELTSSEFLTVWRTVGKARGDLADAPVWSETRTHGVKRVDSDELYASLTDVARQAGLSL